MSTKAAPKSLTLSAIYEFLPLSERTVLKHRGSYPFALSNDMGGSCDWRVEVAGQTIGVVVYAGGRKLCAHGFTERQ